MSVVNQKHVFGATGQSAVVKLTGKFNVLIEGGIGTVQVERSLDAEVSWQVVSRDEIGTAASYTTATDTAFNGMLEEPDSDIPYRFNCTAYTSGNVNATFRGR